MSSSSDHNNNQSSPRASQKSTGGVSRIEMVDGQIDSRELFVAGREIIIRHGKDTYRLRLTSQNKLILTK
jgi:hemin uptake protein HemP